MTGAVDLLGVCGPNRDHATLADKRDTDRDERSRVKLDAGVRFVRARTVAERLDLDAKRPLTTAVEGASYPGMQREQSRQVPVGRPAVALVTGASRGIGRAIALELARTGHPVALVARERPALRQVMAEIETSGGTAIAVELDVRNRATIEAAVERVEADLGPIGVLVNNAGIQRLGGVLEVSEQDWLDVLETNLTGAFRCAQVVARRMLVGGIGGSIVNIASVAGLVAFPDRAPYAASKAGLIMLTRSLALELAPHRIRVNAVAPTFVDTDLGRLTLEHEGMRRAIEERIPLGRLASVEDVAAAVAFLVGSSAPFITGVVLPVDGGVSAG